MNNKVKYKKQYNYYLNNREKIITKSRLLNREKKIRAVHELFNNKCYDCGNTFHPSCYDFHHLDPKIKDYNPSVILRRKWEEAVEELKKCIMLCSNCHRIRHWNYEF